MLSYDVICPDFDFVVQNAPDVIRAMSQYELAAVKRRIESGQGASGPLPIPKDGGRPLIRSGQLLASIDALIRTPGQGLPYAEVLPGGTRTDQADRQKGRARDLRRRRGIVRQALKPYTSKRALFFGVEAWSAGLSKDEVKARLSKIKHTSRLRGGRNMDVASILANPPKDKRALRGNRGIYDVFHATADETEQMTAIAGNLLSVALVERESGEQYAGQGEVG